MTGAIDPREVLDLLANDVPASLHANLLLTGSLAPFQHRHLYAPTLYP